MSVISNVLKEEVNRLKENVSVYERSLVSLPRGSIYIAKINNQSFVYRKYKENGKVISKYIGKANSPKAREAINQAKEYKRIKNNLRIAKIELKKLERVYRIYD
ncbi:MAG: hypothetical protein MJ214_01265 [Bacilli bacterium]|nr:hypothetical protein [Bacilli bacterium]